MPGVTNPSGMTISYNGYTFPVSVEPPQITLNPEYDSADRVVTCIKYTITLSAMIYPESPEVDTDIHMFELRQLLSAEACELRIEGTGFSDLVINEPGGRVWDAQWGPHPRATICRQIGSDQAWRIDWHCEVKVPEECPEFTKPTLGRVMEFNFSVNWDVDMHGLTRRTVTGHIIIPLTRLSPHDRTLVDNADRLRDVVKNLGGVPEGFRRVAGPATLSEDRRTLNFSFTDEQLSSPWSPPPNVVIVRANHSFSNAQQYTWVRCIHTLSADYTVARNIGKAIAWQHFRDLFLDRMRHAAASGQTVHALTLSCNETLYEMSTSFTLRYMVISKNEGVAKGGGANNQLLLRFTAVAALAAGGFNAGMAAANARRAADVAPPGGGPGADKLRHLNNLFDGAGFWRAPPRSNWGEWFGTMSGHVFDARGHAKLNFDNRDDQGPVNICQPPGEVLKNRNLKADPIPGGKGLKPGTGGGKPPGGGSGGSSKPGGGGPGGPGGGRRGEDPFGGPRPPRDNSWLEYTIALKVVEQDDVARLKLLPMQPVRRSTRKIEADSEKAYESDYAKTSNSPFIFQTRAEPSYDVVWTGYAVRAGYSIDRPRLMDIGGAKAIAMNGPDDFFTQSIVGDFLTPIVVAKWRMRYALERTPTKPIGPADNPMYGAIGQDDGLMGFVVSK